MMRLHQMVKLGESELEFVAERVVQSHNVSKEEIYQFDYDLIELAKSGKVDRDALIRLSRFNYNLSLLIATDKSLIALTAFTLFQFLGRNVDSFEERIQLIEESVPVFEEEDRPDDVMSVIYYHTTCAYRDLAFFNKSSHCKVILYGTKAIELIEKADRPNIEMLQEMHYYVGTALSEAPMNIEKDLEDSVYHQRKAVEYAYILKNDHLVGSALNNLGNSLRLLRNYRRDSKILTEAIEVLQKALPFCKEQKEIDRTLGNIAITAHPLSSHKYETVKQFSPELASNGLTQVALGEKYLKWLGSKDKNKLLLDRIIKNFCDAIFLSDEINSPQVRARAELGIGMVLNNGETSAETAMGICFFRASERRWRALGEKQRVAAANYNLGHAFSTILDYKEKPSYLTIAIKSFETAREILLQLGMIDRAYECLMYLAGCYKILGESGDKAAAKKSIELLKLAKNELKR